MVDTHATIQHEEIRGWAEQRGGRPAQVKGTGDPGLIRLDFPYGGGAENLELISWDEWFDKFDNEGLAFLYQEETAAGEQSNFNKLVNRDSVRKQIEGSV